MENLTQAEFARHVGKSAGEINKWISSGKISEEMISIIGGRKFIKLEIALAKLNITATKPNHTGKKKSIHTEERLPPGIKKKIEGKITRRDSTYETFKPTGDDFHDAEVREKLAKAETAEINLEKLRGNLISSSEVYKALFEFGNRLRKDIQAVPEQIVDALLASASREEAICILQDAYDDALRSLASAEDLKLTNDAE